MIKPTLIARLLIAAFLGPGLLCGGEASLRTLDRKSFAGHLRLGSNEVFLTSLPGDYIARVAMTNLQELRLISPPRFTQAETASRRGELASKPAWRQVDLGLVRAGAQAECQAGRIRLSGGGALSSEREDSWHFAFRSSGGDVEIVARLLAMSRPAEGTWAGLMMRESLRPEARRVFIGFSPRGGIFQWRDQAGQPCAEHPAPDLSLWLRLKREGDWFYAYTSRDGQRWRMTDRVSLPMGPEVVVGCALAGRERRSPRPTERSRGVTCLFDQVRTGTGLRHHSFLPRVLLQSGSMIVEDIAYAQEARIHFAGTAPWPVIPFTHVARLDFQWIPVRLARQLRTSRPGVLLATGEFLEGDLKELRGGRCAMSTVLFGLRRYDAYHEITSILLRPPAPAQAPWEVRTWGGSVLRGTLQSLSEEGLILQEPLLGPLHVPFHALQEISRRRPG